MGTPVADLDDFERKALGGDPDAVFELGVRALQQSDPAVARSWFEKAAESGHAGAMYNLGVLARDDGDLGRARE